MRHPNRSYQNRKNWTHDSRTFQAASDQNFRSQLQKPPHHHNPSPHPKNSINSPSMMTTLPRDLGFPAGLIIPYDSINELITYDWNGALNVLEYLLLHPEDRNRLRTEARRRSPTHSQTFFIQHYHLNCLLPIGSFDSDRMFVQTIKYQIVGCKQSQGNFHPSLHTVIQPPHLPFLLDPYGLLSNPQETARNIGRLIPFPCEILVLPEGPQVIPL
jgi:hypothetical protein